MSYRSGGGAPLRGLLRLEPLRELPETVRTKPTFQRIDRIRCVLDPVSLVTGLRGGKFSPALITVLAHATGLVPTRGKPRAVGASEKGDSVRHMGSVLSTDTVSTEEFRTRLQFRISTDSESESRLPDSPARSGSTTSRSGVFGCVCSTRSA